MVESVRKAIAEAERRRNYQMEYNLSHGISPISMLQPDQGFPR